MELHQLRYFLAVAEDGGFGRAARRCRVSQPSLSQAIKKLEGEIGAPLFDRLGRIVALTPAGHALLPRARRILAEVRELGRLREEASAADAPLAVGAIPTMAPYLLPPVLARFTRERPGCALTVREDFTDRLVAALLDGELDLAVMSTPVDADLIDTEVLASERLLVASARGAPVSTAQSLSLADLRDEPAVVLHEMHCLGQQIEGFCAARRVRRRIVCRSTQLSTVQSLVGLGLGVSIVPEMAARADRSRDRVYRPLVRGGPTREIAVAYRQGRTRSPGAELFVSLLRETLKRPLANPAR